MEWIDAVKLFGPFGLLVGALYMIARDWITRNHALAIEKLKHESRRIDIEEKKADAMTTALTTLSGKIDSHATADLTSHKDMAEGIAAIHGKLDGIMDERDRTPVERIGRVTPPQGTAIHSGYRPPRPGTKER